MSSASGAHVPSDLERRIRAGKADPISPSQRASAAKIRVLVDEKLGRESEEWVKELAKGA